MTTTLFDSIRRYLAGGSQITESEATHLIYMVYTLCKVRGYKVISKLFPHSVEDLEPTYKLLEKYRDSDRIPAPKLPDDPVAAAQIHPFLFQAHKFALDEIEWRVPYVLLLWLSVIGLIPFDLNALDNDSGEVPLKHKLLDIAHHFLQESSVTRNAAAELLSTLLTRPDMKAELSNFIEKSISTVTTLSAGPVADQLLSNNQSLVSGLYHTLSLLFQKGEREFLIPQVSLILKAFFPASSPSNPDESEDSELEYDLPSNVLINKKASVKLVQRLALVLLAPRIPKWRYQRRTVSLLSNLKSGFASAATSSSTQATSSSAAPDVEAEEEEEGYEIPEELEIFVQLLLSALRDKDTIVRWSAAKGIGRMTHRLPQALADEIVGSLLELFDPSETDFAWHGACLSIAELARRGLLLPSRLPSLLEKLNVALQFEIRRGAHTTGHHVRDAACYVAWALARAYDPSLLRDILSVSLASSLLLTALFDREVNCRRAAAAAFQEHVGRQGSFPHGIDIISIVNFFTLSNRSEAYLRLAPQVAAYEEYSKPVIDHLAFSKATHVDHHIRSLAAKALGNLTLDIQHRAYIAGTIVPKLIPLSTSPDFSIRQGSIQALAEIVFALSKVLGETLASESNPISNASIDAPSTTSTPSTEEKEKRLALISQWIPLPVQEKLWNIPADVERARLYRGRGAEYLRIAICRLILSISELGMSLKATGGASSTSAGPTAKSAGAVKGPAIAQRLAAGLSASRASKDTLTFFVECIEENLRQALVTVVDVAVDATRSLAARYLPAGGVFTDAMLDRWMSTIATDSNQASRRGHCLAIGGLPLSSISAKKLPQIIACLLKAIKIIGKKSPMDDAEVRKNAIQGLIELVTRVPIAESPEASVTDQSQEAPLATETQPSTTQCQLTFAQVSDLKEAFLTGMSDYTTDNRGDIGSLVREAAISAFGRLLVKLRSHDVHQLQKDAKHIRVLTQEDLSLFVGRLIRLALEKIDRTRERAGVMFEQLIRCAVGQPSTASLYRFPTWSQVSFEGVDLTTDDDTNISSTTDEKSHKSMIPLADMIWKSMEEASELEDARSVITKGLNWTSSRIVFPMLAPLIRYPEYRYWVNLGIIRSVGGANNSKELVEDATGALMDYLRSLKGEDLSTYASSLMEVMKLNVGNEQVITSLWSTMDIILSAGLFSTLCPPTSNFAIDLLTLSRAELKLPSSISKLTTSVPIFAHLLAFKGDALRATRESALRMMLFFLAYKYPVIRKQAAETLYLQLETSDHFVGAELEGRAESIEKAKEILTTVSWAWDADFQAAKESLSSLLGIKPAVAK